MNVEKNLRCQRKESWKTSSTQQTNFIEEELEKN